MKDVIYMNINTYGNDERLKFCREYIYKQPIKFFSDIALLPIPTTKDGVTLNGVTESIDDICRALKPGDAAVGYGLPRSMREGLSAAGALAVDISLDEEFLTDNARLTAEGTIGRILSEEKKAPRDMKIGIIGYGRIGKCLLNLLLFLGADVIVFTSKSETRLELCAVGVSAVDTSIADFDDFIKSFQGIDILINTAPSKIIPNGSASSLAKTRIIELASGDNMPDGVKYEKFSSVPALMYPESAGFVLGAAVIRMLGIEHNSEKEMAI